MPTRWRWPPDKFVRVAHAHVGEQADELQQLRDAVGNLRFGRMRCTCIGSTMIWPTVMRGLGEERGPGRSPACACARRSSSSSPGAATASTPSKRISPAVGSWSRRSTSPAQKFDFPQPNSPTRPSVSPRLMSSVTSLTAPGRQDRAAKPARMGKNLLMPLMREWARRCRSPRPSRILPRLPQRRRVERLDLVDAVAGDEMAGLHGNERRVLLWHRGSWRRIAVNRLAAATSGSPGDADRRGGLRRASRRGTALSRPRA